MKPSTKIILDKRRAKNDGTYPLALRIIHKRVPLYITLDYSVSTKHWDHESQTITSQCRKYKGLARANNEIQHKRIEADEIIDILSVTGELERLSASELKNKILNRSSRTTVKSFTDGIISQMKIAKRLGNASVYEQALSFLERYTNIVDLSNGNSMKSIANSRKKTISAVDKVLKKAREKFNARSNYELLVSLTKAKKI